jgi:hypothetical protein
MGEAHHRHLIDLRGVVLLDVSEDTNVITPYEVDSHTLPVRHVKQNVGTGSGMDARLMAPQQLFDLTKYQKI